MHPHTGASTSAESSAWSVRNCPSFLAPSAQALAVQHPFTAPFQIGFGGVLRLGHPRKNMLHVPFPTSHNLTFRHHSKRGQPGHSKNHSYVIFQRAIIQQLYKSPGRWALQPRPNHLSKVNPPEAHICNAAQ